MKYKWQLLQVAIVAGAAYHIVTSALVWGIWPDCEKYISMAEGLSVGDPFGRRIFIPWLASVVMAIVGCDAVSAFYNLNMGFVFLASLIILREYDLLTALIVLSCTGGFSIYFGKALLDAAIFLLIVLALYFANHKNTAALFCVLFLSVLTHPIGFVLCGIIFVFSVDLPHLVLIAVSLMVFYLWFMPVTYVTFRAHDIIAVFAVLKMLSVQWLGVLTLRRDRQSLMILALIAACCGFSLFLTWPARAFVMLSPILAPRLRELIR